MASAVLRLSPHFTLAEWTASPTARRQGIVNQPRAAQIERMRAISLYVLEPTRAKFQHLIHITSGYRRPQLNRLVSKEELSAHQFLLGMGKHAEAEGAVDFQIGAVRLAEVFNWLAFESGVPYDLLILERGKTTDSELDDCLHYQISAEPRRLAMLGPTRGEGTYKIVTEPVPVTG